MNTANYVDQYIKELKAKGIPMQEVAWQTALACLGWPYVFGARGEYCTPATRRVRYNATKPGPDKDNIKDRCKNFEGAGTCSGCKFYPDNSKTRCFDCRGFTYWVLKAVYGWSLDGAGCTSQWNDDDNWKSKGKISDGFPENTLVCLFYPSSTKPNTMEHTGFGFNDATVECATTVYKKDKRDKKWTHWGIPKCVEGDVPPVPVIDKPTLRIGSTGEFVVECQNDLISLNYDLSPYGADGKYGKKTANAVKDFQSTHVDWDGKPLVADGVCGQRTWWALDEAVIPTPVEQLYTVIIPHLSLEQAEDLQKIYPDAEKRKEG